MKLTKLFGLIAALALSGAANAVVLTGSAGSNGVTDYSENGLVSFDLDLENFSPTTLNFVLEADDLQGPLSFNALVRNLAGAGLERFSFSLQGIAFTDAGAGSVTPAFGSLASVQAGSSTAAITFAMPEYAEFQFGNVLGGGQDWLLDTSGLAAGDSFSITATVPEPSSAALVLPMLCMAGLMAAARRRKKD